MSSTAEFMNHDEILMDFNKLFKKLHEQTVQVICREYELDFEEVIQKIGHEPEFTITKFKKGKNKTPPKANKHTKEAKEAKAAEKAAAKKAKDAAKEAKVVGTNFKKVRKELLKKYPAHEKKRVKKPENATTRGQKEDLSWLLSLWAYAEKAAVKEAKDAEKVALKEAKNAEKAAVKEAKDADKALAIRLVQDSMKV